jgi:hypothetical protein
LTERPGLDAVKSSSNPLRSGVLRLLVTIGTVALVALVVIVATGGFVVDIGPFRLSARGLKNPLIATGAAWGAAALFGRAALAHATAEIAPFVERHATAIAVVIAAAVAGTGVGFNTFAAHSTDPSGYISTSKMLLEGQMVRVEPLVKAFDWYGGGWNFSPLGHRPGVGEGEIVPTYPLGLPAVMALTRAAFGEWGAYVAVPLLGGVLVVACYLLGRRLHSATAGVVAAALVATSPVQLFHVVQPMSDVPAAAWLVLALAAALGDTWWSAVAAGTCLGMAAATRPNLAPLALAVALCAAGGPLQSWRRPRMARVVLVGAGSIPVLAPTMALNLWLYGSVSSTGYGGLDQYFSWSNIAPNVGDYVQRILQGEMPALWLTAVAATVVLLRRAAGQQARPPLRPSAVLAGVVAAVTLAVYLPYGIFPDWAYLRFLLPALAVAFVLVGGLATEATARVPAGVRGLALVIGLTIVCTANVEVAAREQVFRLRFYESRYRSVGLYLKETLPDNPVVITFQESGAIHYYTGAPISRWDFMPHNLEDHVSAFRQRGLHPIIVVEDWERPNLKARFPKSRLAALDWTPRADIGETTHVWILDPADIGAARPPLTDTFK